MRSPQIELVQGAAAATREQSAISARDADRGRETLQRIGGLIGDSTSTAARIAALVDHQLDDVQSVDGSLREITAGSGAIEDQARAVAIRQLELSAGTERASQVIARFDTGGLVPRLHRRCQQLAGDLGAVLEGVVESAAVTLDDILDLAYERSHGDLVTRFAHIFDVSRVGLEGFDPPKYHTAYDALVDREMMSHLDALLAEEPGLEFALPFDLNTYAPAHNSIYSRDITGDRESDLAGNRTKRLFLDSRALLRAARMDLGVELPARVLTRSEIRGAGATLSEQPASRSSFLLQTYTRDTGAVLTGLSVPLFVHGHRYGSAYIAWNPERLRS